MLDRYSIDLIFQDRFLRSDTFHTRTNVRLNFQFFEDVSESLRNRTRKYLVVFAHPVYRADGTAIGVSVVGWIPVGRSDATRCVEAKGC